MDSYTRERPLTGRRIGDMKIFIVFGTRPEAIKLAPLIYKLKPYNNLRVVSSGQHLELLNQVIDFYKIQPDYSFGCMMDGQDLEGLYKCIHRKMRIAIDTEDPDLIIVQGDTFTTYSAAFVGGMLKKPVFHVEAGLRTGKKFFPFPEEMLRSLVSRIADFHFAPTPRAANNLRAEGIREDRILITGNTVVDAFDLASTLLDEEHVLREIAENDPKIPEILNGKKLVLVTSHRRENIGDPLLNICRGVKSLGDEYRDTVFLWPLHMNPDVRNIIQKEMEKRPDNVFLTEAFTYPTMVYLMQRASIILSDSGGIQEEASTIGKPVIILRESTERPEVLEFGYGFLTEDDCNKIADVFGKLHASDEGFKSFAQKPSPFGDGRASERILRFLRLRKIRTFIENYPASAEDILVYEDKVQPWRQE
jgi:UDP-N-acetylglucosamine 2-epimerase (non-hydrolysing)